ncbi:unnamed protein product [Oppiella nova]|uniref:Arrestin-like N-terminal domain-containing protein n=1 Tax=Oppiella nova TaxID=334625 RepID=A0A7R9M3U4_9ACAR|nr:unnamed protein product [Oppiella nova]CAG2168965.1 unnamed protein product [Oppiella nova]
MMLDSHNPTYGLGSHITGKCVIALEGRLDLSQVRMRLKGLARVMWPEGEAYSQVISKGVYEFPFNYQLPHDSSKFPYMPIAAEIKCTKK